MKTSSWALVSAAILCGCGATRGSAAFDEPAAEQPDATPPEGALPPPQPACEAPNTAGEPLVYAHAAVLTDDAKKYDTMLAVFDAKTLQVREWIPLDACKDGFLDMAVDRAGRLFMAGANGLYWFDPKTQACTPVKRAREDANGDFHYMNSPNNLTFAPAKIWSAAASDEEESLIGFGYQLADDRDLQTATSGYLRFDGKTGDTFMLGPYPSSPKGKWGPSGDLVAVVDTCKKVTVAWATVIGPKDETLCRACEAGMKVGLDCGDCLYEFDLKTGSFSKELGLLPYSGIFGLAFWGGTLLGFTMDGKVIAIDPSVTPPKTTEIAFAPPPGHKSVSWMGAGSTTLAPLTTVR